MSKIDNILINNLKSITYDMLNEGNIHDYKIISCATLFYNLYLNHLIYLSDNPNYVNRDRVIVSNKYLPAFYATLSLFGYDINSDNLKEYKKLNSGLNAYNDPKNIGIEIGSFNVDVVSSSVGIAIGERYLENLIKVENPKCDLINFHTYSIVDLEELEVGSSIETLNYIRREELNKLVIIAINNTYDNKDIDILERKYLSLSFDVIKVKNHDNFSEIDSVIDEAKRSRNKTTIVIINNKDKEIDSDYINNLRIKYKIEIPYTYPKEELKSIKDIASKRINKIITKWQKNYTEYKSDLKVKEILNFLENKTISFDFKSENYRINDNYLEELIKGNSKMFNIFTSKSPFTLALSSDFSKTLCEINKSQLMSKENPLGRNLCFSNNIMTMGGVSLGLASLGFKVFVSTPLILSNYLNPFIKNSTMFNYPITYIFTQDSFLSEEALVPYSEINNLRLLNNILVFRPCDINEVIGIYEIISNYHKVSVIIINSEKTKKLIGTNPKYVVAGAYRVRRERGDVNGIILATGSEVSLALEIAEELIPYGIDLRVVSMPSQELFKVQSERYKYSLLPKELKTFVIEFGSISTYLEYTQNEDYIFGLKKYSQNGTKLELLNDHNLNKDYILAKIVELMKK